MDSDPLYARHRVTGGLLWATTVLCLSTFQFGFHLAVLNAPMAYISCAAEESLHSAQSPFWGALPQCVKMLSRDTALLNTAFTVGGLLALVFAGTHAAAEVAGRKRTQMACSLLFAAGLAMFALGSTRFMLLGGRFLAGLAAGASMVIAPILVSELTSFHHRGLMGLLLQFGVAFGILGAQLVAFPWASPTGWRWIFVVGAGLAFLQFVLFFTTCESPKWLILHRNDVPSAEEILHLLRSNKLAMRHELHHWRRLLNNMSDSGRSSDPLSDSVLKASTYSETLALLDSDLELAPVKSRRGSIDPSKITVYEFFTVPKYRKEWIAVMVIMTALQLCGMNSITFYGVSILSGIVPAGTNVLWLTSALALANVVSMLSVLPCIDSWGRKPLLLLSVTVMGLCAVIILVGMSTGIDALAALGCFGFIVGFSAGLGPIPFLMVPELSSHETMGLGQSMGTMWNWLANVAIAYLFPVLNGLLGPYVFYVFFGISVFYFVVIWWTVPETKGSLDYDEVWLGY